MRGILTIFKKEMRRYFTDVRMLLALFLPGIIIYILYSVIGMATGSISSGYLSGMEDYSYKVAYSDNYGHEDDPYIISAFSAYLEYEGSGNSVVATSYDKADLESQFQLLKDEQIDAVIYFSDDFELNFGDLSKKGENNINFYYNGKSEGSSNCYSLLTGLVSTIYDGYTINTENGEAVEPNITGENYLMDQLMAVIFPAITAMMLFSSVVSICPSAVAGEKERGTIASILLTPTRKGEIAGGKILAISITALASGLTSFLGILFSMPQMMGSSLVGFDSFFSPVTIILLLFLVLTALLLFTAIGLLISSLCKSIREASTYLSSLMFLLTVAFFVISLLDTTSLAISFIPVADIVACMSLIISGADMGSYLPNFLITIGVNLVVSGALIYLVTLCFKSERIMFAQ